MKREILFKPAWDKTNPDPKKDYGVSCLTILFHVVGTKGVVEFELSTNWYQEHVMKRRLERLKQEVLLGEEDFLLRWATDPYPMDVCYFAFERVSEEDIYFENGVLNLDEVRPYYYGYLFRDKNGNRATDFAYRKLVDEGDESLWQYLEEYYVDTFGEDK